MRRFLSLIIISLATPLLLRAQGNLRDSKGRPDGFWTRQEAARMGEPAFTEFGTYSHGLKTGLWYKLDANGETVAIERFANDVLNGESKYFQAGKLSTVGNYRGLNPAQEWDTIWVMDPVTGVENRVEVATDRGSLRHGTWRFYDLETGRLLREEEYQVDELIFKKDFSVASADSAWYKKRTAVLPHNRRPNMKASTISRLIR